MPYGRFERMIGIPEDEYHHLKSLQQTNNPVQDKFLSLSNEYKKHEFIGDVEKRVQRQGETLHELMKIKDDLKKRLIASTPRPYRSRVQGLFHFIDDKINVNERGEIKSSDGSLIDGSNIGDLVQHAVRDRRRNIIPEGWNSFVKILKDNNTPRMILNYDTLQEMDGAKGVSPFSSPSIKQMKSGRRRSLIPIREVKKEKKERSASNPPVRRAKQRAQDYLKTSGNAYI